MITVLLIVHGLLASGLMSACRCRSSWVGRHVRPRGGPNGAQVFSSLARLLVVNLASSE